MGARDGDTVFLVRSNKAALALEAEFGLQDTVFYSTIMDSDAKKGFHNNLRFVKITTIKMYSYRFFSQDSQIVLSPVCFRLVAGMDLAKKIVDFQNEELTYITCYRKDGKMKGCQINGQKEQDLESVSSLTRDGYRL